MKCKCSNLPDAFYINEAPWRFEKSLHKEDTQNWMHLYSCPKCGTLWTIDEWDKYQDQVVARVKDRANWATDQAIAARKRLLLESRGGTTDETCMWAGCHGKKVKGVAYCLEHLWDTGARR